jgi:hypothetical protein
MDVSRKQVDEYINQLYECKSLSEAQVKDLCEKVGERSLWFFLPSFFLDHPVWFLLHELRLALRELIVTTTVRRHTQRECRRTVGKVYLGLAKHL